MRKLNMQTILDRAHRQAQRAAEVWLREAEQRGPRFKVGNATLLDNCGCATIVLDKRQALYKFQKELGRFAPDRFRPYFALSCRQEHGLHVAACEAAAAVLRLHGFKATVRHWID